MTGREQAATSAVELASSPWPPRGAGAPSPADQVRLVGVDARRLPFAAAQFDGFAAVSALEHVTGAHGDRQALAECARVLRPGGVGLVMVPSAPKAVCRS